MDKSSFRNDARRDLVPRRTGAEPAVPREVYVPLSDYAPAEPEHGNVNFLLDYWNAVRRSKGSLLLFVLAGVLAAIAFTVSQTPVYQTRSTLELQSLNDNFLNMKQLDPTVDMPDYSSDAIVQTQIKILQSNSLLQRVVQKLSTGEAKPVIEGSDRLSAWRKMLGFTQLQPEAARQQALGYAAGHFTIRAPENTRILEIVTDSTDPRIAADFTNTLATEYIEQNLESRWKTTQHTGEWLTGQLEGLKVKLERSEDELQAYAQSADLMFTTDKESVAEEKLRQLQQELLRAESDRVVKQSKYEMSTTAPAEALPEVLDSAILKEYHSKLAELRRNLAAMESTLTPAHYKVQRAQMEIAELQKQADKERASVVSRIRNEYDAAKRREDLIRAEYDGQTKSVSSQAAKVIHYGILKREVETNRQLYDSMLQKVKEAGVTAAMRASKVRVVDPAETPVVPYKPDVLKNALMGLMGGLFCGIGFVILRERVDRSIQSPGDVQMYLHVPEFGVIPSAQSIKGRRLQGTPRGGLKIIESGNGGGGQHEALELAIMNRSPSLIAESFRSTLASILFSSQAAHGAPQVFVMTSPSPSEGKTTVLSNLGLAMAETKRRVLLIDCDMRRPRLHDIFDLPNDYGLRDVLESPHFEEEVIARATFKTDTPGMCVMPSGTPGGNISTLLYSSNLAKLVEYLRQHFDAVFIDTPPMLQMPDARIVGRLVDGVIMVIRSGKTTRDTARVAIQRLAEDGTPVLGTILNDWNPAKTATYGRAYGYDTYESGYYKYHKQDKQDKQDKDTKSIAVSGSGN
jgi:capsular exopolysaccharide synthesis family protein